MEFRLLGTLEVEADGVDVTPARPKQRALLALLLLRAGEIVPSDQLIESLWGDQPPPTAQTALHGHISAIRKRLGPGRIETRAPGYLLRLAEEDELDLHQFERMAAAARSEGPEARADGLRNALALFRGEPLADFRFDSFASREAARLEELRLATLEQQIEADLELGRQASAVPLLERLVADHPLRELLRAQLMLALYRVGRQADALQVAQDARRILAAELGIDPSPVLQQLEHRILNQDPILAAPDFPTPVQAAKAATRPTGIVTFLSSDIDRSRDARRQPDDAAPAEGPDSEAVRAIVDRYGGFELRANGGSPLAVFARAREAASAAIAMQRSARPGGTALRLGLHSTRALPADEGYVGPGVYSAAHIGSAAHHGQILVSQTTADLLNETPPGGAELRDLGEHRLGDLGPAQRLFQLAAPGLERDFPPIRGLEARTTNLPILTTDLVGRRREIGDIVRMLREPGDQIVTLTGVAGTGKTRLALHAAAEMLDHFPDGVLIVNLAPLGEPDQVMPAVAQALGLDEMMGPSLAETIARHVRNLQLMIVLDNFEHVREAAREVAGIARAAPGARLLVTSRTSLRVPMERVYRVPPLDTPAETDEVDGLIRADSVTLFAARARAVRPEFEVTGANAQAVSGICRALDGLPLAIELAATRIAVMPPGTLLRRLDIRLGLLTGGARGAPARHRGLQAAIDWSYELLRPEEQSLFKRFAVFTGGCTLDAAENICADGVAVIDGLASLVDQSLIALAGTDEAPRFSMLESIREYAAAKLVASGEDTDLRRRHAEYFLTLTEEAEPHLRGSPGEWLARLERDHNNLRAAMDWLEAADEMGALLRFAGALWRFWYLRGYLTEGRLRLESALRGDESGTAARAKVLIGAAVMAVNTGDARAAKQRAGEGLALHRALGDTWGAAYCQLMLGAAAGMEDDLEAARDFDLESANAFRALGDDHSALLASRNLARTLEDIGDLEGAQTLHQDNLRRARATHNLRIEASSLGALAAMAFDEGRVGDALWMLKESLRLHRDLGDRLDTAVDLSRAARTLAMAGKPGPAVQLLATFATLREEIGTRRDSVGLTNEETLSTARRQLDEGAFAEAWRQGQGLTLDAAVALALDSLE
jgi:predicted ATPase/DNA-binding SARP family transcriptional activator